MIELTLTAARIALPYLVVFAASLCYAILFNSPVSTLLYCGLCGAVGWLAIGLLPHNVIARAFLGAFFVGVVSTLLAKKKKHPRTIFVVAGIVPLVPGATAYFSMLAFVKTDYLTGTALALNTLFSAGAIAAGLILASIILRQYPPVVKR